MRGTTYSRLGRIHKLEGYQLTDHLHDCPTSEFLIIQGRSYTAIVAAMSIHTRCMIFAISMKPVDAALEEDEEEAIPPPATVVFSVKVPLSGVDASLSGVDTLPVVSVPPSVVDASLSDVDPLPMVPVPPSVVGVLLPDDVEPPCPDAISAHT